MTDKIRNINSERRESWIYFSLFSIGLLFNLWGTRVGWESQNLPGLEFRQAQTAISAYFIQKDHDFSLAYPTPVLGKPWSVPMEFPLYQWSVVGLSNLTGLDLTKSGRLVSQACFYLCFPAVFLLLARMGVSAGKRWLVLLLVVTCPFYIFYSRSFLMETMALMFSLWFWLAFQESAEKRNLGWMLVAILAGSGAGLVKVTTFMLYLLPSGWWALRRLWRGENDRRGRDLIWMTSAVALPFAPTLWWLHFADATKALNPSAQFIREANLRDFNFGTWAAHFSSELWRSKWIIITEKLSWSPALVAGIVLALSVGRRRGTEICGLLFWFGAVLFVFPVLYGLHEYYFIANTMLLLMALGLVLVGMVERRCPVWLVLLGAVAMAGGQALHYIDGYYQAQKGISWGGDGLTRSLRDLTRPDEILVVTGHDWNSMTPYFAERRALMIRAAMEGNASDLDAAFAALTGEKIGALVLTPGVQDREKLIQRAVKLGIDPQPLYRWHGLSVHLPLERRSQSMNHLSDNGYDGVSWAPNVEHPKNTLADDWFETSALRPSQRQIFSTMRPQPVRFFSTFGPILDGTDGVARFGAHPVTRLIYQLPAGNHFFRTTMGFSPAAYDPSLGRAQMTDGVEVTLSVIESGEENRVLLTKLLKPRDNRSDRGTQWIKTNFTLQQESKVELFIGPGPDENNTRDWVWLGPLTIE